MARQHPRLVLLACVLCASGLNAYLLGPAGVLPGITTAYEISRAIASLAISAPFVTWMLFQLPSGYLMDRYDNRTIVAVGVGIVLSAAYVGLAVDEYVPFLAIRIVAGLGAVLVWATAANVVSQVFGASDRAIATSVFTASAPLGFVVAQFVTPLVADASSWQFALVAYATVSTASLPLLFAATGGSVRTGTRLAPSAFATALTDRSVVYVSLASFCTYSLFLFFNSWMATYATERLAVRLTTAGGLSALVPLAGLVARPLGGVVASDRTAFGPRTVIAASFVGVTPLLIVLPFIRSLPILAVSFLLVGFSSQLSVGVYYAYVRELTDASSSGTSFAVLSEISTAGTLSMPFVAGWLVDAFSWTASFGYATFLALAGLVFLWRGPKPN